MRSGFTELFCRSTLDSCASKACRPFIPLIPSNKEHEPKTKHEQCSRHRNRRDRLRQQIPMAVGYIGAAEQHLQTWGISQTECAARVCDGESEIIGQRKALPVETGKVPGTIAPTTTKTVGRLVDGPAVTIPKASRSAILVYCESIQVIYTRPVAGCVERIGDGEYQVPTPIQAEVKSDILKCQGIGPRGWCTHQPKAESHSSHEQNHLAFHFVPPVLQIDSEILSANLNVKAG